MTPRHGWRVGLLITFFITSIFWVYTGFKIPNPEPEELTCHFEKATESLPDISDFIPSVNSRSIFFLETSCNSYERGKIFIKARQACAVESAAKMNPNMDIYLLYASPGIIKEEGTESDRFLQALKTYQNVKILHFDIERFIQHTPVESLWTSGKIKTSLYPMAHISDTLRLLVLYKFGGIYLDLDVVIVKSLEEFPDNFAGAESNKLIANGVMGFSRTGRGHDYVSAFMNDIRENFDGADWAFNGPKLITRIMASQCRSLGITDIIEQGKCDEFTIFPPSAFYLVSWPDWEWYFKKNLPEIIEQHVGEGSYMIHVWNKMSYQSPIPKDKDDIPYLYFAKKYCPKVIAELDEFF